MQLVEVYTAPNEAIARMLQGVLERYGIKSVITPSDANAAFRANYGGATPPFDPWTIAVPEADAQKAREILEGKPEF